MTLFGCKLSDHFNMLFNHNNVVMQCSLHSMFDHMSVRCFLIGSSSVRFHLLKRIRLLEGAILTKMSTGLSI